MLDDIPLLPAETDPTDAEFDAEPVEPVRLPPAEVRFTDIGLQPYPDGRRVKLTFGLTPFLERPCVDVVVVNAAGHVLASLNVIEALETRLDFTLHLRGPQPSGRLTAQLTLFYLAEPETLTGPRQVVAERSVVFDLPATESS